MKKQIITMSAILIATFSAMAQKEHHHDKGKKETAVIKPFENVNDSIKSQINKVLVNYFEIKDALVADNNDLASKKAKAIRRTLELVDVEKMNQQQREFYMPLQKKLDYDAEHIQGAPNIDHIREHFASFSDNLWSVAKAFNATNERDGLL